MKPIALIFATTAALLQTNILRADEAFLSQASSSFSSAQMPPSPSAIAVPLTLNAALDAVPVGTLAKQNIFEAAQHGTNNSSLGFQIGGGNLSIINQQGSGNKVVISQRNAR